MKQLSLSRCIELARLNWMGHRQKATAAWRKRRSEDTRGQDS